MEDRLKKDEIGLKKKKEKDREKGGRERKDEKEGTEDAGR